jgi:hypothetical protein
MEVIHMALDPLTQSLLQIAESDIQRARRYQRAWAYYKAEEYLGELGKQYAKDQRLFKHMRRAFGYVTQCVDTDARFVMKERLQVNAEEDFATDIYEVWERSNLQAHKYKLARFGCNLGDAYLIVSDVGDGARVVPRLIVANTEDMTVWRDPDDESEIIRARQTYTYLGTDGKAHSRTWLYYPDRVERYTGDKMDEGFPRDHAFGEVPVIPIKAIDIGEEHGLCSWHNTQGQLDQVNELGSYFNRILLRYADPQLMGIGMMPGEQPVIRRGISEDNVYYLPNPESKLEILEYRGDVLPHILSAIDKIADNVRDQLPELSLSKIREQSGLSGYAVSLHCAELVAKIAELRGNFANGIEWANSLALRAIRRSTAPLEEFANRIVYEPVLPEDLLQRAQIDEAETRLGIVSRRSLLRARGMTEEEIDERLREVDEDRQQDVYGQRLFGELEGLGLGGDA